MNNHNNKHKNIILILGNGYDLDIGYKTSYADFFNSYFCPKDYPAPIITHLNEKWDKNEINNVKWYDLENELLNYFKKIKEINYKNYDIITEEEQLFLNNYKPNDYVKAHYPLYDKQIDSLAEKNIISLDNSFKVYITINYLEDLKKSTIWRDRQAYIKIKNGLNEYIKSANKDCPIVESTAFTLLKNIAQSIKEEDFFQIYTFNYTTLHPLLDIDLSKYTKHIHGSCRDNNIILGTQDSIEYNEHYDFLQKSFDPKYSPPSIVTDLLNSEEIIIFGHSLGLNDRQYFKAFFERQSSTTTPPTKKNITIFTKDDKSVIEIKRSLQQMTNNNLANLYGLNNLKIIKTSSSNESRKELDNLFNRFY